MQTVIQDMKFALRVFRKSPLFAAVIILTLALSAPASADAQPQLWQTGCLYGTVFALRVSLV